MGYTTLVRTVRHTYRVWDDDMVRGLDLLSSVGIIMYGILDRDQRNDLYEFVECKLIETQVRDLEDMIGV